jgi:DNA replication and repair protein RecF
LAQFRNHRETTIECSPTANVFLGNNGAGKTNVLEGISYLCLTKSFYAASDATVLQIGTDAFAVEGTLESDSGLTFDLRVDFHGPERRKEILINHQAPAKLSEVIGQFPVVVLSPENNAITFGGPGDRRRFIDLAISQASRTYLENLIEYRRILRQRNRILADNRDNRSDIAALLEPWDESLVTHGARIVHRRMVFAEEFEPLMRKSFMKVAGGAEHPGLRYEASFMIERGMGLEDIRRRFAEMQRARVSAERRAGITLTGPHRDELIFQVDRLDLRGFASQGQHKTFLVALKLAEFAYLKDRCRETPLLLLDDVLSELDEERGARLLREAETAGQTFITATDSRPFAGNSAYRRFWVSGGSVTDYESATDR